MSGETEHQAAIAADRFAAAHRALRADPSIQFTMQPVKPPAPPPAWLESFFHWLAYGPIGRFFSWIASFMPDAPVARALLWALLAILAATLLWVIVVRLREGQWRLPRRRRVVAASAEPEEEAWAPDAAPVRAWLEEADLLAADGRYAEAVHHLLFRSIEDIARRRPRLVRPALTSRELAAADAVPAPARDLFARIARLVERSLFGGRPVSVEDWTGARAAYADFALPRTWRA
ncbi:DUF4129 domain-containing protein [Sphingomonas sp. RT2P30]|uniref:DUF4129 domain-containing protein n=1 Tax=Parasphingomonas halimpatiens TaxID=3096162 RepID=UPI002FC6791F